MSAPNQLIHGGAFTDPAGNPLASGYLVMQLSHDSVSSANEICAGIKRRVNLDASGNVNPSVAIWSNNVLTPSGSFYYITVYASDGTEVVSRCQITIPASPNPYDLATATFTPVG